MNQQEKAYPATAPSPGDGSVAGNLFVGDFHLRFESAQGTVELPYDGLEMAFGTRKDPRVTFTHPKHEGCEVVAGNEDILRAHPFRTRNNLRLQVEAMKEHREGMKRVALTFAFFAVFIGGSALVGAGLEWGLPRVIQQVPVSFEKKLGDEAAEEVRDFFNVLNDTNLTAQLDGIVQRLARTQPKSEYQFRVAVLDTAMPNAFAVPGGSVFVTKGLLMLMTNPVEVAGVLAHEIAHVTKRHGCRTLIMNVGPGYAIRFVLGDNHGVLSTLAQGSRALVGQTFSREFEREADETGFEMMLGANLDPRGLEQGLKRLRDFEGRLGGGQGRRALNSHPPTPERIGRLAEQWSSAKKKSGFDSLPLIKTPPGWTQGRNPGGLFP